jgi:hypothetical protein
VIGTVPLFCIAGFIESFMTRHTEWSDVFRLMVILLSASFIVYYYIVLPYLRNKSQISNIKPPLGPKGRFYKAERLKETSKDHAN